MSARRLCEVEWLKILKFCVIGFGYDSFFFCAIYALILFSIQQGSPEIKRVSLEECLELQQFEALTDKYSLLQLIEVCSITTHLCNSLKPKQC